MRRLERGPWILTLLGAVFLVSLGYWLRSGQGLAVVVVTGILAGIVGWVEWHLWHAQRPLETAATVEAPRVVELVEADQVEALGQDGYAALLARDRERLARFDALNATDAVLRGGFRKRCRACHSAAVSIGIHHPIWDGPFHGGGSGRVDVRAVDVCPHCDIFTRHLADELGLWPSPNTLVALEVMLNEGNAAGRPIRLPWLDPGLTPIALHPDLWDRPAFHNLLTPVQKGSPPPPALARQPHLYVYYEQDQLRHAPPATRPRQPCEVCDQPADAPIHHPPDDGATTA